MKKQLCALAVGLALMGCSDDESLNQAVVDFGIIEGYIGNLHTNQKVAATDGNGEVFPGHANFWDLNSQGSVDDGGTDQWDNIFDIQVNASSLPFDQQYNEVRFLTPEFGQAQGFVGVATRNNQAVIAAGRNNQLLQPLDLRNATGTITLSWTDTILTDTGLTGEPLDYQVLLFDSNGNETVLFQSTVSVAQTNRNADISAFRGTQVVLGFRVRNTSNKGDVAQIDNVSVLDGAATQFVTNGNFDGGSLANWIDGSFPNSTNVVFNNRTIDGVTIQRFFYADPNQLWARQTDTFANNTGAPVNFNILYRNNLGSDGRGIIYLVPNANNQALASFDGSGGDRDIGLIFGNAQNLSFTSAPDLATSSGNTFINWEYNNLTLQPGQTIVMVHFAIMTGNDTRDTPGVTPNTQIPDINDICQRIVTGLVPEAFEQGIPLGLRQLGFFNWQ